MAELPLKTQMLNRIRATGRSEETFKTYWIWCERYIRYLLKRFIECRNPKDVAIGLIDGYNDYCKLDWRLAVKVLSFWVIMRGSYAAPILDRYANPHVLPSKIGVLEISFSQGF